MKLTKTSDPPAPSDKDANCSVLQPKVAWRAISALVLRLGERSQNYPPEQIAGLRGDAGTIARQ